MNYAQIKRYRVEWAKVLKLLTGIGEFSKEDAEKERHEIHRAALGKDKSSKDFSQKDFDAVLDHFEQYLVLLTGPLTGPSRAETQPVKRLIYAIERLGLPDPYLQDICRDQFKTSEWRSLDEKQLTKFRFTAAARANRRKANSPEPTCDDRS